MSDAASGQVPARNFQSLSRALYGWLKAHEQLVWAWGSVIAFVLVWQLVIANRWANPVFFSSPGAVVDVAQKELRSGAFWDHVQVSSVEFILGYVIAIVIAVPFGLFTGLYSKVSYAIEPWLNGLNSAPQIALLPLIVLWVGVGSPATTAIVAISVFFPVAINIFYGLRTIDRGLLSVATSFGAPLATRIRTLILPGILPFVIAGARLGIGRGVIGVVIGEFYSSQDGLGNYIFLAGATLQVDKVLFGALFITFLSLVTFSALARLEHRLEAWRPQMEDRSR